MSYILQGSKQEMENSGLDNKSCKIYFLVDNVRVYFNADFDSGNVQKVQQIAPYVFKVTPGFDKSRSNLSKTFFHFKVYGLKMCTANFVITRMSILERIINSTQKEQNLPQYHPVFRRPDEEFSKVSFNVKKYVSLQFQYNCFDEPQLSFSFEFDNQPYIEFAFTYPYGYEQCLNLVQGLHSKYLNHESIYFHNEILCYSQDRKKVNLITITEKQNCQKKREENVESLFPGGEERPFKVNKPVIFMTARVHPGQTPASYAIEGAIRFLLNQRDCRSYLLRKNFLIKIIPMVNPDGVFHGMFRTDLQGQNLNRIYSQCQPDKHPTIWSIRKYAEWLSKTKNVLFFFDFHAHPSTKNFFIYGNSFNQICMQTQAQFFGKLIESNCPYFENMESIYSEKQMKSKHKNDNYSKQGCARVFMHKLFNIIHSYTIECGYFGWTKLIQIEDKIKDQPINTGHLIQDRQFQKIPRKAYNPQSYMLMGKSILITILDLFKLNPFPKKVKDQLASHAEIRKSCGSRIYHDVETFKMTDANSYKKLNQLSTLIQEMYYSSKLKGSNLKISTNQSNNLMKEQLTYLNASPKTKQLISQAKVKKTRSLSQFKQTKKQRKRQIPLLSTKIEPIQIKKDPFLKPPSLYNFQNNVEVYIASKILDVSKSQGSRVTNLNFLYKDLQRFNEIEQQNSSRFHHESQKAISTQSVIFHKNRIFQSFIKRDLSHLRTISHKEYNTVLQQKQFLPETRESKIKNTLQKSISLRKGSHNKIVLLNKNDLKSLRIANLVEKKIQHTALVGPTKKFHHKGYDELIDKDVFPSINVKRRRNE